MNLTQPEVAERFRVSESTIYRERRDGKIKCLMVRGKPIYTPEQIAAYEELLKQQEVGA